ncbi:hypothetical protein [Deinococcus navajonensis]|uniref:Lipoprotein n=1 Tax=Deinococcus navajonensis TaxID=309884 RepID=A0ABV8XJB9_9DEIO
MKAAACAVLAPLLAVLVGCGSLDAAPSPLAGDLLSAPTTLNLSGQLLRIDASPRLSGAALGVHVRLQSGTSLPRVTPTAVFMVTRNGVWTAPLRLDPARRCSGCPCLQGQARGRGEGVRSGEPVQVVVRLKDARGRLLWLRDPQATVTDSRPAQ